MFRWSRRWLLATLIAAVAAAPTATMQAAPPDRFTVPFELAFVLPESVATCGFPVEVAFTATWKVSVHTRADGTTFELDRTLGGTTTFTNLATGAAISGVNAGPNKITYAPDGTIATLAIMGRVAMVTLPGEGLLLKDVGRIVFQNGDPATGTLIFEAGDHPIELVGDIAGLCVALV